MKQLANKRGAKPGLPTPVVEESSSMSPDGQLRKTAVEQLVALIMNQDHVAQGFLKFLVSLQGGLAVALSYFLTLPLRVQPGAVDDLSRISLAVLLIASFGVASTIALTAIVIHERKWQGLELPRFCGHVILWDEGVVHG